MEGNADNAPTACKFLLPLKIAEQGLDAHVHLVQLSKLARTLSGMLVLPSVGNNEVGACCRWRFGVYYDERALLRNLDGGNSDCVIPQDRFKARVDSLEYSPASQIISGDWTYPKNFPSFSVGEQSSSRVRCFLCLRVALIHRYHTLQAIKLFFD